MHLVQRDRGGKAVHLVDCVVHHADQRDDRAAVEGGDEHSAHVLEHVAGDVVGKMLLPDDLGDMRARIALAVEQARKRVGPGGQRRGMRLELVEEPPLLGHQRLKPAQHRHSTPHSRPHCGQHACPERISGRRAKPGDEQLQPRLVNRRRRPAQIVPSCDTLMTLGPVLRLREH